MKTIVVKVGGSAGIGYENVCADVSELHKRGERVVLVHGGSQLTNELAEKLGHPPNFVTSPSGYTTRLTDRRTMEIFMMAYCGQVNKSIVELLQKSGVNAVGLSGIDGGMWRGPRKGVTRVVENGKQRIVRNNLTGKVEAVNSQLLNMLFEAGYLPVLTPPAISHDDEAINVDGDRAAAETAKALSATDLIILSNVPGVMRDINDPDSRIKSISIAEIETVADQYAEGRMKMKLLGTREAIEGGVVRVIIADARVENCLVRALDGDGTVIS